MFDTWEMIVIQYPQTPPAVCSLGRCTAVTSLRYMYLRVILHLISFVLQLLLPPSKVITKSYRGAGLMFEGFWLSWKGLTWTCELWQKCLLVDYFFGLEQSILVHFVFFSWLYITLVFSCYTVEPVVTPCCHWVINKSYPIHQLFWNIWGGGCHWILVQSAQVIYVCMYVICLECSPGLRCAGHVNWTFWVSACFMTKLLGLVMTGWERIIVTGSSWDASTMDIDERQLNVQYR